MRYPMLTRSACEELSESWLNKPSGLSSSQIHQHVKWIGDHFDLDLEPIVEVSEDINTKISSQQKDKDQVEGECAVILYQALKDLPVSVLDDRGFWRYLSIAHFIDFIAWREQEPFKRGKHMKYLDAENSTEAVLSRMYLRVKSLGGDEYGELASVIPYGTDFWRSHIIRVKTGTAPALTRALVRSHRDNRLTTQDLRELAKDLSQMWTNIILHIYDDTEADELIRELRLERFGDE